MHHARRATERLRAILHLQPQQVQTLGVHLLPLPARALVRVEQRLQVDGDVPKILRIDAVRKVIVKTQLLIVHADLNQSTAVILNGDLNVLTVVFIKFNDVGVRS